MTHAEAGRLGGQDEDKDGRGEQSSFQVPKMQQALYRQAGVKTPVL